MYVCVDEILILFLFHSPVIVKINIIVHLVFVAIHEKEISVSSAELLIGDPQLGNFNGCHMPFNLLDVFFYSSRIVVPNLKFYKRNYDF